MDIENYSVIITENEAGMRLDKALSAALPQFSRSRLQSLIESGMVCLEQVSITDTAHKTRTGRHYHITVPAVAPTHMPGQDIPLNIVHEDEHILVLNKQAGLTVHPAPGHADMTLVNALIRHCGASLSGIGGVARPGIVHRIDKDTSGLLVVAKHDAAHASLSAQLAERTLKRQYRAIVWGSLNPLEGGIHGNIGRSPLNRKKMAVLEHGGKPATTHYKTLQIFQSGNIPYASLLECRLESGRTHQIRVHLSKRGYPLLGDPLYGGNASGKLTRLRKLLPEETVETLARFKRQALHACRLGLIHPASGEPLVFEAPLPEDMQRLVNALSA